MRAGCGIVYFIAHKPAVQPAYGKAPVGKQLLLETGHQDPQVGPEDIVCR